MVSVVQKKQIDVIFNFYASKHFFYIVVQWLQKIGVKNKIYSYKETPSQFSINAYTIEEPNPLVFVIVYRLSKARQQKKLKSAIKLSLESGVPLGLLGT